MYTKPAVRNAWGETATAADLQDPGNTYAKAGWQLGQKPPRQYFNWVLNYNMAGIRYLCQQGIANWDTTETYSLNSVTITPNGFLALSKVSNNTNNNPEVLGSFWDVPSVLTVASNDNSAHIANTHWVTLNFLPASATFSAINGQIGNGQVPVGAVTQWQGSLSIGGGQVTSAVARSNTVNLVNGNAYLTFNWNGQSGQPTWLFGSNDGANAYVWNPANFSVANANTVAGLSVTSAAAGSTVMARDGNGYAYAVYFNQASGNNDGSPISQFITTNGSDGFLRKQSVAAAKAALGALAASDFPALLAGNGYQRFPSGVIIQWGEAFINGTTTVTFPIAFPTNCTSVTLTNISSTNQIYLNGAPLGRFNFSATNGSSTISWLAIGY